jgi:hypothetical protein
VNLGCIRVLVDEKLPVLRQRVVVACEGFSCLGYLDVGKIWRFAADNAPIEDLVLGWEQYP